MIRVFSKEAYIDGLQDYLKHNLKWLRELKATDYPEEVKKPFIEIHEKEIAWAKTELKKEIYGLY